MDYNCYLDLGPHRWTWAGEAFTEFAAYRQASGQDAHSLCIATAGFVNPAEQDFRPAAGSPLIDAGTVVADVTEGFTGAGPDLGAVEAGAG
jgi:hypothetical protein